MEKLLLGIVDIAGGVIADDMLLSFFQQIVGKYKEKYAVEKGKTTAAEGSKSRKINTDLEEIADGFIDELHEKEIAYTEEELRRKFELMYGEYIVRGIADGTDEGNKEELWKRFIVFTRQYLKKYNESITFGEKRAIEILRETNDEIKGLKKNGLDKEAFTRIASEQGELLSKLCENINIPMIDLELLKGIVIRDYESKYTRYGNTFDFDKNTNNRINSYLESGAHVLSLGIKNIGRTNIREVLIKNINIYLEKEIFDDNPESGSYVLPFSKHLEECSCKINILPNGEQMIHIIFTDKKDELSDEEIVENFLDNEEYGIPYEYDRLFMVFDICLKGDKEEQTYTCFACLTKMGENNMQDINGWYHIDYSGFCTV